jgi:hypothetical protein
MGGVNLLNAALEEGRMATGTRTWLGSFREAEIFL